VVAVSASLLEETLDVGSSSSTSDCGISGSSIAASHATEAGAAAAAAEGQATDVLITHGRQDDVIPRCAVER
jgi:hypothetical protein